MDFKRLINSLDTLSENTTVHKGTYGTSHGKEDVRDQYGHKVGKIDKDVQGKEAAPKLGRGRPKKDGGEGAKFDTSALSAAFGGSKKPSGKVGTVSKKHSLKEYIESVAQTITEGEEKSYTCVHAKKGKCEVTATTSYEAAKKAAAKWKLNGTSGIDAHLNTTKVAVDEGTTIEKKGGRIHKGSYGTSYEAGDEGVKKAETTRGRGRPKKGADDSTGEVKKYDSKSLSAAFGGGKAPKKAVGKVSASHKLKEDDQIEIKPASQTNTQVIQQGDKTLGTVANPQLANQIKQAIGQGQMSLTGDEQKMSEDDEMNTDGQHGGHDPAEYDMEGDFVKTQLHTIARSTRDLEERLSDQEDLPEWVEMKISQAQGMLASVSDYMDSQHERDTERETGHEEMVSEKAKSKAQQRFFGMVHAMQKGKKVPGASKELKGVAKDIGKQDAKDFAKTKHKGLPDHVSETSFEDQNVSEEKKGLWANIHAKQERIKNGSGEHMRKPGSKGAPTADALRKSATEDVSEGEQRMSRAAKGNEKYGKDGMKELAKAGRDGASEKKLDTIRNKFDKYDNKDVSEAKDLPGKQDKLDVAEPKGKLDSKDFAALRAKKKVKESTTMKTTQLTEGAMKDLLINFYDAVSRHKGDGSVFDLKKARNVQQAEEVLKALVKHGDEYSDLDNANQNELVNQTLKYLAHEKELPFNTLANTDKQRFATRTPADLSKFRQSPATPSTSSFSKPGGSMATPSATGSNGFLKTLSTPQTFKESNDMKDKQFESWENKLNSLLTEGITVSHSTGQQGSPDSLSINATEQDASELMSILRNSGMEMFGGGKEQDTGYGAPQQDGEEGSEEFHQGVEIAPSPEVVGDGSDMLALIKKMSGIGTDSNTPGSVEVDYEDEEGQESGEEHSFGGEEQDSGEDQEQDSGEDQEQDSDEESDEEGEEEVDEGNFYTGNLAKAREQGKKEADLDGDGDMEKVREGEEDCMECGYPMESCGCEHVEEGYANDAGGDAMGDTELLNLKELLNRGNDLHRQKHTQATGNIQKVTMETKLMKDSSELLTDWKKLSGIK